MKKLIVGLNPAWQQTLHFDSLNKGDVNRAVASNQFASGKGINALRTLLCCDESATLLQFIGGATGQGITNYLDSINVKHISVDMKQQTRICTTVLDNADKSISELIGTVKPIKLSITAEMGKIIAELPLYDAVLISGTCPTGVNESIYANILNRQKGHAITILDSYKNIDSILSTSFVNIVKINRIELFSLTREEDIRVAAKNLFSRYDIEIIIITDGERPTYLFTKNRTIKFTLPRIEAINPIGAGDCSAAILLNEFAKIRNGLSSYDGKILTYISYDLLNEICVKALVSATASCLTLTPGLFSPLTATSLEVTIEASASLE